MALARSNSPIHQDGEEPLKAEALYRENDIHMRGTALSRSSSLILLTSSNGIEPALSQRVDLPFAVTRGLDLRSFVVVGAALPI
jgi:hypothetical protein